MSKYYKVPESIWEGVLKYLVGRPYQEVAQALEAIGLAKIEKVEDKEKAES